MSRSDQRDFLADLRSPDKAKRREIIEELSYTKRTYTIECPTPPPRLLAKDYLKSSLGYLDVLPLELFHVIFQFCILDSLSCIRRLNWRARCLLDNWPVYYTLLEQVPKALLVFSRTGAASYFTADQVRDVLYASECSTCGHFGSYLYLPQCQRCCFRCLDSDMRLSTIKKFHAISLHGHGFEHALAGVRFLSTIPAGGSKPKPQQEGNLLASYNEVFQQLILNNQANKQSMLARLFAGEKEQPPGHPPIHFDSRNLSESHYGLARQVSMLFPYLKKGTGTYECAILCRGCSLESKQKSRGFSWHLPQDSELARLHRVWQMEYSEKEFIEHLKNCKYGHFMWENYWKKFAL